MNILTLKRIVFAIYILPVFFLTTEIYAQNKIFYRAPFHWKKMETKVNGPYRTTQVEIYFSQGMEEKARETGKETEKIILLYGKKFFTANIPIKQIGKISWYQKPWHWLKKFQVKELDFVRYDSLGNRTGIVMQRQELWQPERLVILLYPNMEDYYDGQQVIHAFVPPGVLGFTEMMNFRVTCPYPGNRHDFTAVLAHEIAHALRMGFAEEIRKWNHTFEKPNMGEINSFPLWFDEGFAEYASEQYLKSQKRSDDYRAAIRNEVNLLATLNDRLPALDEFLFMNDFRVYTLGYNFLSFVFLKHSKQNIANLIRSVITTKEDNQEKAFLNAWYDTFRETLPQAYVAWQYNLKRENLAKSYFGSADISQIKLLLPKSHVNLKLVGEASYDTSEFLVYYKENKKWGVEVVALHVPTLTSIPLIHQFKDKSLFMRMDNPPAIYGKTIAVPISKEGQDRIYIYTLHSTIEKKFNVPKLIYPLPHERERWFIKKERWYAKQEEEIFIPHLIWITDITFLSNDSLLFVGMDINGTKDIYRYIRSIKKYERLTDTPEEEMYPKIIGNNLFYIRKMDIGSSQTLCMKDSAGTYIINLGDGFPDQLAVNGTNVAVRFLMEDGTAHIVLWHIRNTKTFLYYYGESSYTPRIQPMQIPTLRSLLNYSGNKLVIMNGEMHLSDGDRLREITIDTTTLFTRREIETIVEKPHTEKENADTTAIQTKSVHMFGMYTMLFQNERGIPEVALSNATGEHVFTGDIWSAKAGDQFYFYAKINHYDFSKRLITKNTIACGQFYNLRAPYWFDINDLTLDQLIFAGKEYVWPFDLYNAMHFGITAGYLTRYYALDNPLRTPLLKFNVTLSSFATFTDPYRSSRHGHQYVIGLYQTLAHINNHVATLDGAWYADFREYIRPWETKPYLALRLAGGMAFGKDPYKFFLPDLYRLPGFYLFDFWKSIGTSFVMYQAELRFPLMRVVLFQYEFWEEKQPLLFMFSLIPTAFIYGGGITDEKIPSEIIHRAGYALNIGMFFQNFYFRIERFTYLHNYPRLRYPPYIPGTWHTAILISFDW